AQYTNGSLLIRRLRRHLPRWGRLIREFLLFKLLKPCFLLGLFLHAERADENNRQPSKFESQKTKKRNFEKALSK
ncbi:MAG: hypothetical protein IKA44_05355, partial [Clostridia bacterium]|nr:hypothetical protein [Clostridia bacterium]